MTITLHGVLAACALLCLLLAGLSASLGRANFMCLGFFFAFAWVVVR